MASSVWAGSALSEALLTRVVEQARRANKRGCRPRLALFDWPHQPCFSSLRRLAESLQIHVQVEALKKKPTEEFMSSLRLLEKSRGLHGVLFPNQMSEPIRSMVQKTSLARLDLDAAIDLPSPQVLSFIQLSESREWSPIGRRAVVLCTPSTRRLGHSLESQLTRLGLRVDLLEETLSTDLWWIDLVWLCSDRSVKFHELHLNPETVLIDSGSAYSLPPCLSLGDQRLASVRQSAWCPPAGGLGPLVNLNRLSRLLRIADRKGNLRPGAKTEAR